MLVKEDKAGVILEILYSDHNFISNLPVKMTKLSPRSLTGVTTIVAGTTYITEDLIKLKEMTEEIHFSSKKAYQYDTATVRRVATIEDLKIHKNT